MPDQTDESVKLADFGKLSRWNARIRDLNKRKTDAAPAELKTINDEITDLRGKISKLQSEQTEPIMTPDEDLIEDVELNDLLDQAKIAEAAALEEAKACKKEGECEDDDKEDDEEEMDEAKADPVALKKQLDKYKSNLKFAKDDKAKATIQNFIDQIQGKLDALEEAAPEEVVAAEEVAVEVDEAFGKKDDDEDDDADGKDDDNDGKADDDDNEADDDDSKGEDKDKPKPAFLKKIKKEETDTFVADMTSLAEEADGLSEDFKEKAGTLFEVALTTRVRAETVRLQEEFDNKIAEEVAAIRESLEEKVDNYLTYAVESWVEDNKLAVESGLRTEVAESFISSLKSVFVEHYIEVPETKKDIVSELETKLVSVEEALCASGKQAEELTEQVEKLVREKILAEAAASLADTQGARLQALAEDVEFVDEETFRKKVATIKECYFQRKGQVIEEEAASNSFETTEVIVEDSDTSAELSPTMQNYVKALARVNKANTFTR